MSDVCYRLSSPNFALLPCFPPPLRSTGCTVPPVPALRKPSRSLPQASCLTRRYKQLPLTLLPGLQKEPSRRRSDWSRELAHPPITSPPLSPVSTYSCPVWTHQQHLHLLTILKGFVWGCYSQLRSVSSLYLNRLSWPSLLAPATLCTLGVLTCAAFDQSAQLYCVCVVFWVCVHVWPTKWRFVCLVF